MIKHFLKILIFFNLVSAVCFGQETDPGPGFQMVMMNNPAFSGSTGDGTLRLSYLNFYPGNNYNLHSAYLSYDSFFAALHGGAGFYLSDDYLGGIINDLRGGLSYAYFLQTGKDLVINAGLSASFYHQGFNFDKAVLPDQIDPLGGVSISSSESLMNSVQTVFDVGTGILIIAGNIFGGFSISHLTEPDLSTTGISNEKLKRKYLLNFSDNFDLVKSQNLKVQPLAFLELQGGFISAAAGCVLESKYLSVNGILLGDNEKNLNVQTGFSLKIGKISIYYNYRFNAISENKLLPFSLLDQAGLTFSLNSVDKRKIIKTINFPEL